MANQQSGSRTVLFSPQFKQLDDFISGCLAVVMGSFLFLLITGFLGGVVYWAATGFKESLSQILQIMFFYA
jgi:hypothetical protein